MVKKGDIYVRTISTFACCGEPGPDKIGYIFRAVRDDAHESYYTKSASISANRFRIATPSEVYWFKEKGITNISEIKEEKEVIDFKDFSINIDHNSKDHDKMKILFKQNGLYWNNGWNASGTWYGLDHRGFSKCSKYPHGHIRFETVNEFESYLIKHYSTNLKTNKDETLTKNSEISRRSIKGTARVSKRRLTGATGIRPEGNKTCLNVGKAEIRHIKIISNVRLRSYS